jgi:hypothetical protein
LAVLLLLAAPTAVQAQFSYIINADNTVTITGLTAGSGGAVTIPATTNGLRVTSIAMNAFLNCHSLTSVTIANGVTSIGANAFEGCSLTNVAIPDTNLGDYAFEHSDLTSLTIPDSVTNIADFAFAVSDLTSLTIANGVTTIGEAAFADNNLASVTIPGSVTNIREGAFANNSLTSVFFTGSAPIADSSVFSGNNNPTVYYLPGTTGWSSPFASRQALLWNALIQTNATNFGVQSNQFGFYITGTFYIPIVVEACTNLANPVWIPIQTFTLTSGLAYFSEPLQTNNSGRYYRISSP